MLVCSREISSFSSVDGINFESTINSGQMFQFKATSRGPWNVWWSLLNRQQKKFDQLKIFKFEKKNATP